MFYKILDTEEAVSILNDNPQGFTEKSDNNGNHPIPTVFLKRNNGDYESLDITTITAEDVIHILAAKPLYTQDL